jgi:tRNA threonylcarbamoyladenosine biosynthesis protein TsaE
MIRFELPLADERATAALAARLAAVAAPGDVLALRGDLGSGKTSFARAFIRALGDPQEEVPSPTFSLVQTYDTTRGTIWHFDLYRLQRPEEVLELGLEDALADGIVLIEWPDRLGGWLPRQRLDLTLAAGRDENARVAVLEASPGWGPRLAGFAT